MAGASKRRSTFEGRARKRMRMTKTKILRNVGIPEATFKRHCWVSSWDWNTTTTAGFARLLLGQFNQITNYAEYAQLFDLYKITGIKVTLLPRYGEVGAPASSTGSLSAYNNQFYVTWGTQKGSFTVPTGTYGSSTFNILTEQMNGVRTQKLDKPVSFFYKPNISEDLTSTGAAIIPASSKWLSTTAGVDVSHIGVVAMIHDSNFAALEVPGFSVDVLYTFNFKMKGQR